MLINKVREFTSACNEKLPEAPIPMDRKQIQFLREMVNSEFDELEEALEEQTLEEIVVGQYDALIDSLYYTADAAVRQGFNLDPVFDEVHKANLRKIVDGKVIKNEAGKVLKPEGWYGPEEGMKSEIHKHMKVGSWSE